MGLGVGGAPFGVEGRGSSSVAEDGLGVKKVRVNVRRKKETKAKSRTAPLDLKGCGIQRQLPIENQAKDAPPAEPALRKKRE